MAKRNILGEGKYLRLVDDDSWEYVERRIGTGVVAIVAVTSGQEIILVEQFRPAVGAFVIELPAGLVGDDAGGDTETGLEAAHRELVEETGYTAEDLEFMTTVTSSAGLTSETVDFYWAHGLRQVSVGGGDPSEDLRVHVIALGNVEEWLVDQTRAGKLIDAKLLSGLFLATRNVTRLRQEKPG